MSAAEGARVASMTVKTLQSICSDEHYDDSWDFVIKAQQEVYVNDPKLPRKTKVPQQLDEGSAPAEFQQTPKSSTASHNLKLLTLPSMLFKTDLTNLTSTSTVEGHFS